jgi:EF-P beta-lysylation protein EpmB
MTILAAQPHPVRPNSLLAEGSWRRELRQAVRDPAELCQLLRLPPEFAEQAARAAAGFPLLVPAGYLARIRPGDTADPLLRQVLPLSAEETTVPGYEIDPVDDAAALRAPGLLHKYPGRALLIATGACAIHCRYCFRRHYPYAEAPKSLAAWEPALAEIAADSSLHEVLLSGGDPLVLVDDFLAALTERLATIAHVRRLRIHTRLPIVIPERVCDELLAWLAGNRLTPIVVVHANHPAELDKAVAQALARLVDAGVVVLNQSVLLRGVNDTAEVLAELCERLVDLRVIPYYVHQLDPVAGATHFDVPEAEGRRIVEQLAACLPGYAVPRYVREVPGRPNKTLIV